MDDGDNRIRCFHDIAFPSTPLAHVSKTKLTSVANLIMLLLLLTMAWRRGGGYGGECRRGGLEGNVEGGDLWDFSMVWV